MSTKIWMLIALSMIQFFMVVNWAQACEGDQAHGYISAGVGSAGTWLNSDPQEKDKWDDDGKLHFHGSLGYRYPVFQNWLWLGPELGHHSTVNKVAPEPELDYLIIKLEARLLP